MKFRDGIINSKNVILSDDITADEIAKLHKGAYCLHHLHGNVIRKFGEVRFSKTAFMSLSQDYNT